MEKTRVNIGEKYWYITVTLEVWSRCEDGDTFGEELVKLNNYFHTKEEAEAMTRKLRAVLNGADVIEMPREEEIEKEAVSIAMNICRDDYWRDCEEAVHKAIKWLDSKLVK